MGEKCTVNGLYNGVLMETSLYFSLYSQHVVEVKDD